MKRTVVPVSGLGALADLFEKRENISLAELLTVPGVEYNDIERLGENIAGNTNGSEIRRRAAIFVKYQGYIRKQNREVEKFRRMEDELIPEDIQFNKLNGLRNEALEKFARFKPISLGQASRIEGITNGDITALSIHLRKLEIQKKQAERE